MEKVEVQRIAVVLSSNRWCHGMFSDHCLACCASTCQRKGEKMLASYKNGFIQAIKNQQLDPVDFSVLENTSQYPPEVFKKSGLPVVTTIRFRDSGLRFEITDIPTTLHQFFANYTRFDAGCPLRRSGPGKPYLPIDRVYVLFSEWLMKEVKPYIEEMKQPDLWQQIEQQKQLVSADPLTDCETSPFTEAEKQQVRVSIGQFRVLIRRIVQPDTRATRSH